MLRNPNLHHPPTDRAVPQLKTFSRWETSRHPTFLTIPSLVAIHRHQYHHNLSISSLYFSSFPPSSSSSSSSSASAADLCSSSSFGHCKTSLSPKPSSWLSSWSSDVTLFSSSSSCQLPQNWDRRRHHREIGTWQVKSSPNDHKIETGQSRKSVGPEIHITSLFKKKS